MLTAQVTDGVNSPVMVDVTVSITDVNEPPVFVGSPPFSFTQAENTSAGALVGEVIATDPEGATPTYSLMDASGLFEINASGEIINKVLIDYDVLSSADITVTIEVTDGTNPIMATATITITNEDEAPVFTLPTSFSFTVAENLTSIGTVEAKDPEETVLTYSIFPSSVLFEIEGTSGVITLQSGQALDFETASTHRLTVRATDGGSSALTTDQEITITVTDVNEVPEFSPSSYNFSIEENASTSTVVGTAVTAKDEDTSDTPTYSFVDGPGSSVSATTVTDFSIDPTTGQISVAATLDYETVPTSYTLYVLASDNASSALLPVTAEVTITVTDVNEAPEFSLSSYDFSIAEDASLNALVGDALLAEDEDTSDTPTYSFVSGSSSVTSATVLSFRLILRQGRLAWQLLWTTRLFPAIRYMCMRAIVQTLRYLL